MAKRHRCTHHVSVHCVNGTGKGPAKCPTCKGLVVVTVGTYHVFRWTARGDYRVSDSLGSRQTEKAASALAAKIDPSGTTVCVRFI